MDHRNPQRCKQVSQTVRPGNITLYLVHLSHLDAHTKIYDVKLAFKSFHFRNYHADSLPDVCTSFRE